MKLFYKFVVILINFNFIQTQEPESHEKLPYKFDRLPTYSRDTPYQDEGQFPDPVYGMAHGHPYKQTRADEDHEAVEPASNERQARDEEESTGHDEPEKEERFPPEYVENAQRANEKNIPRKHRMKLRSRTRADDTDPPSSTEDGPPPSDEPEDEDDGPMSRGGPEPSQTPQQKYNRDEDYSRRRPRPEQEESSEEHKEARPPPPRQWLRGPHHPNERRLSENGDGSNSDRTDGKRYEDSGERNENRKASGERENDRIQKRRRGPGSQSTRGKIVGIDMQMVAGIYPRQWRNQGNEHGFPGRYSPLSGPYPAIGGHDEGRRGLHQKRKNDNEHQQEEHHKPHKPSRSSPGREISRVHMKPKAKEKSAQSGETTGQPPRRLRYDPYNAYFLEPEPSDERPLNEYSKSFYRGHEQDRRQQGKHEQLPKESPSTHEGPRDDSEEVAGVVTNKEDERLTYSQKDNIQHETDNPTRSQKKDVSKDEVRTKRKEDPEEKDRRNPGDDFNRDRYKDQDQKELNDRRPLAYQIEAKDEYSTSTSRTFVCSHCIPANVTVNPPSTRKTLLPVSSSSQPDKDALRTKTTPAAIDSSNFRYLRKDERVDSGGGTRPRDTSSASPPANVTTTQLSTTTRYSSSSPPSSSPPPVATNHTM